MRVRRALQCAALVGVASLWPAGSAAAAPAQAAEGAVSAVGAASTASTTTNAAGAPKNKPPDRKARAPAAAPISAPEPPLDPERARQMREEQAEQRRQMLERLEALKKDIAAGESSRSEAADELASSERAISEANRRLRDLNEERATVAGQLQVIDTRRGTLNATLSGQQDELARMLREQYLSGAEDPFRLLFSGDNPNRIQRDLQYQVYVSAAVTDVLNALHANLAQLQDLARQTEAENARLADISAQAEAERADLVKDEAERRTVLAQISDRLASQRAEAGALERDEKRLSHVVDELSKLIEKQARAARERERQRALEEQKRAREAERAAARAAEKAPAKAAEPPAKAGEPVREGTGTPVPSPRPEEPAEDVFRGNFASLRGRLRLPVAGTLAGRFGATRPEGGPSWKGVFIRAASGTEVKAIAPGRVVFAEWLRGFGNLIIVDHGDEYLSIYGNNESLLKQPGDIVATGDPIATVGNSGGNPETGLYFEMRFQGKPFDPLSWAAAR